MNHSFYESSKTCGSITDDKEVVHINPNYEDEFGLFENNMKSLA